MSNFGAPERVYVELDWYDGRPRSGVAEVLGRPSRFALEFNQAEDEHGETFLVWPINPDDLTLEIEQWEIFVAWNEKYEAGEAGTESHPAHAGASKRWDEIEKQIGGSRVVPKHAHRAKMEMTDLEGKRYTAVGPAYKLSWVLL